MHASKFRPVVLTCVIILALAPLAAYSADADSLFNHQHQLGVRLGVWANNGELPPSRLDYMDGSILKTDINSANVYFEGFGAYRLFSRGMLEISAGFVNRGDVNWRDMTGEYFGNLVLYPILFQFKYYLPRPTGDFMPYVELGGGIYYGRQSVQFTNSVLYTYNETSQTDLNYVLGGGFDWPVAHSIALDLNAKYMPINFGKTLVTIRDYKAFTVSFGVKYLFTSSGKSKESIPRRRP